jgi:hypothetical protein
MPYTGNPSTDTSDAVRLLIGDMSTSTGTEIFADNEIEYFVAARPNVYLAASEALMSILGSTRADQFRTIQSKKVGDLSLQYTAGSAGGSYLTIREKIKQLRMQGVRKVSPYAGGISQSDKETAESDTDWERPFSRVGIHDNPNSRSSSTY